MTDLQRMAKVLSTAALCAGLAASLQGCIGVLAGGAVVGSMAASDRRTLGAQTEDKEIAVKANSRLGSITLDAGHVDVTSYNRKVLLTGEVTDAHMKDAAEQEVRKIEGVQGVMNELEIAGASSYTSRSSDALISTKVEATFLGEKTLNSNSIKVVTERGTVYLLGRVTEREGKVAADLASGVGGVSKVVKMFEYISEEELKSMAGPQGGR